MKKIILSTCFLGICFLNFSNSVFADTQKQIKPDPVPTTQSTSNQVGGEAGSTTVTVTEAIPGMDCVPDGDKTGPEGKRFKCTIQPGFGSVLSILKGLIKYATFITALIGVLMLVVSGVQYSIAGADKGAADSAKKRIEKVITGIVLLFLIGFILNSVAPWIYR